MTSPKRKILNLDPNLSSRILLILLVLAMVAFTIWISGPIPDKNVDLTASPTPQPVVLNAGTVEATPANGLLEKTPTTGVIFVVVAVIVILFAGTLIASRWNKN